MESNVPHVDAAIEQLCLCFARMCGDSLRCLLAVDDT